jgi:transcriptional regulator with XRE-family HTH domain
VSDERRKQCGQRLREAREALGLSQAALGQRVGISQPSVAKWEIGQWVPTLEARIRLVAVVGFDPFSADAPTDDEPAGAGAA